jgi:hypothetical protein
VSCIPSSDGKVWNGRASPCSLAVTPRKGFMNAMFLDVIVGRGRYLTSIGLLFLAFLSACAWECAANFQYDGRTFILTGCKVLQSEWNLLYRPIVGSGPWAYMPQSALFFVPFAYLGEATGYELLIWSNAVAAFLAIILMHHHWCTRSISISRAFWMFGGSLAFWFVLYESL